MSEARDTTISTLSDDELDQVSGGATPEEVASAEMQRQAAQDAAVANRSA